MDTVYETYGEYIKLTWTKIPMNQLGKCNKFEVFAHIDRTEIISAYSNGEKLGNTTLEGEEGCWELSYTETDNDGIERNRDEIVDIEESNKVKFGAASSNKENKKSFKF